jgi:hypothetical protein
MGRLCVCLYSVICKTAVIRCSNSVVSCVSIVSILVWVCFSVFMGVTSFLVGFCGWRIACVYGFISSYDA